MRKKGFSLCLAAITCVSLLAGCGEKAKESQTADNTSAVQTQEQEAADEQNGQILVAGRLAGIEIHNAFALLHILTSCALFVAFAQCADHLRDRAHRVPVKAGQCVGYVFLIPDAIAAVLRLTVNSVAGDTEHLLPHKRYIVTARFSYLFC